MTDDETVGWKETLAELDRLGTEYRADGWDAVTVQAGHTAVLAPGEGEFESPELVYTVPDDSADELQTVFGAGEPTRFTVYLDGTRSPQYHILELADPEQSVVALVAGALDQSQVDGFGETAREAGRVHTRLRRLDGTRVGAFRHDDPTVFFPV